MAAGTTQATNEELVERLRAAGENTPEVAVIMEDLWAQNIRLIRLTVHNLTGLNEWEQGFEDMEQQAYFGFYAAALSYTPAVGVQFSTYATNNIKWELCRYYEKSGYTVRIPAFMKQRFRDAAKKKRELEAETGRRLTYEDALQALGLSPAAIAGTLAALRKLETASIDAEAHESDDGDGVSLLDMLADGTDIETDVIEQIWQQELHALLIKALKAAPTDGAAALSRHYFGGVPYRQIAEESGITYQTLHNRIIAAMKSIRAGEYGPELAEYCPTESSKAKADRLIKQEREAVQRLQLTEAERGLLAL